MICHTPGANPDHSTTRHSEGGQATTANIVPFPLRCRTGKVRAVAKKLVVTKSARHAASYRRQVTEALEVNLSCKGVSDAAIARELTSFWLEVEREAARIVFKA